MNDAEISQYITDTFEGVDVLVDSGTSFFFYNPAHLPPDHNFPFATMVTNDLNDPYSDLERRPSAFRLNIGVGKETYNSLFGGRTVPALTGLDENNTEYDFTVPDQLLPHPVYARQRWVCILNPTDETFESQVHPLLAEAYQMAVTKRNR